MEAASREQLETEESALVKEGWNSRTYLSYLLALPEETGAELVRKEREYLAAISARLEAVRAALARVTPPAPTLS